MTSIDQLEGDHKKMAQVIASQIRGEWATIQLDTTNGTATVVVFPCRDEDTGKWDVHLESDAEWVTVTEVYKYYRGQVVTAWERHEQRLNHLKLMGLEREVAELRGRVAEPERKRSNYGRPEVNAVKLDGHDVPDEVSTAQAAKILGVSKDTVLLYKNYGLLEYRNLASPTSSRPVYAFTLRSVLAIRTSYSTDEPTPRQPKEPTRRTAKGKRVFKHLRIDD
ncbi:MAG: hypothetical protein AB7K24_16150 [Gemmataceae bacterium]